MSTIAPVIGVVGGLLGAGAFFWRLVGSLLAYLHLDLTVEYIGTDGHRIPTARVTVENKGRLGKRIHYAALVIGPHDETIGSIVGHFGPTSPAMTTGQALSVLFARRAADPYLAPERQALVMPLPALHDEQRRIGTETVRQRFLLRVDGLAQDQIYRVTLVVFLRYPLGLVRWRLTGDLLSPLYK